MRLLHRNDDVHEDDVRPPPTDRGPQASDDRRPRRPAFLRGRKGGDTPADEAAAAEAADEGAARRRSDEARPADDGRARRRSGFPGFRRSEDLAAHDAPTHPERSGDAEAAGARRERDRSTRAETAERVETHMKRWDTAGFLTAGAAVALAVVGGLALVRAGVDDTWYAPVVEVARIDHTAALGAVEVGVAALVLIPLLLGMRMVAALVATAAGVVAAVAAIDPDQVSADLALQRGWAIALAVAGIALGLLLVATRDRVKRVERRPVRAERHRVARESREARTG